MRALRIGVYTLPRGRSWREAHRAASRRPLPYDFELRALAAGLAQGTTSSLGDLAAQLAHAGLTVRGIFCNRPLSWRVRIAAGTHEALRHPRGAYSLVLRFSATWVSTIQASIRSTGCRPRRHCRRRAWAGRGNSRHDRAEVEPPLERYLSSKAPHRGGYRLGKWIVEKLGSAEVSIVKHVLELVHGVLLAGSIDFHEVKQGEVTSTHYGPGATDHPGVTGDHIPVEPVVFIVQVDMKVDLTRTEPDLVSCGEKVEKRTPTAGPRRGSTDPAGAAADGGRRATPQARRHRRGSEDRVRWGWRQARLHTERTKRSPGFGEPRSQLKHRQAGAASGRPSATTSAAWSRT